MLWHGRLTQVGRQALKMFPKVVADALKMTGKCNCESCTKCKFARKPFTPNTTSHATEPLHLAHLDIYNPFETAIRGGQYMLLFIDHAMRHTDEYILKDTSEGLENFKEWKPLRDKESGKRVKQFRTDGGAEYTCMKIAKYLKSEAILMEMTSPNTPQSIGVVERANCTIMECI
jgi:hypothetical protein